MANVKDIVTLLNEYSQIVSIINNKDSNNKTLIINEITKCIKKYEEYDVNELSVSNSKNIKSSRLKKIDEKEKIKKISELYYKYEKDNNLDKVDLNFVKERSNIIYRLVTKEITLEKLVLESDLEELKLFELKFIYYILFNEYISRTKKEIISSIKKSISRTDYYSSFTR